MIRMNYGYYKNITQVHSYHSYDVVGKSLLDLDDKKKHNDERKILSFMKQLNETKKTK